jgi:hypothetical protein
VGNCHGGEAPRLRFFSDLTFISGAPASAATDSRRFVLGWGAGRSVVDVSAFSSTSSSAIEFAVPPFKSSSLMPPGPVFLTVLFELSLSEKSTKMIFFSCFSFHLPMEKHNHSTDF